MTFVYDSQPETIPSAASNQTVQTDPEVPKMSFLTLPFEIRLNIYSYLVTPGVDLQRRASGTTSYTLDYHEYEKSSSIPKEGGNVLKFRNTPITAKMIRRKQYKVRSGRLRSACQSASYGCHNTPPMHTEVLRVNKQIHNEVAELIYGSYTFDFDTHIEACVPFLSDLTPFSRSCVRRVGIVKRALPYEKDFDRCEWSEMCDVLSTQLTLRELSLGVVAGKPATGWAGISTFKLQDFDVVSRLEEMTWVDEVASIKGLQTIDVRACIEHSPPPESNAMAFFVTFSASVEPIFAQYMSGRLIAQAA